MKEENKHQNLKMKISTLKNPKKTNAKKAYGQQKTQTEWFIRSSLLEEMEFSISFGGRDMVKLRNEKSQPVLKEESEEELFGVWTQTASTAWESDRKTWT